MSRTTCREERAMKRTTERITRIEEALEAGATLQAASAYAGIDPATLRRWRADDDALRERLERAQLRGEVTLVKFLWVAAENDWRAAAWLLTHRWPNKWSEKRTITIEEKQRPNSTDMVLSMLQQIRAHDHEANAEH